MNFSRLVKINALVIRCFCHWSWDVKILIFQGALDQVLQKVDSQRPLLK
jgi:hypothetical protein